MLTSLGEDVDKEGNGLNIFMKTIIKILLTGIYFGVMAAIGLLMG